MSNDELVRALDGWFSQLAGYATGEATDASPDDEDEIQEFGENSWFAELDRQKETLSKESFSKLQNLTKSLCSDELKTLKDLLSRIGVALSMTEAQTLNARYQDVVDALEAVEANVVLAEDISNKVQFEELVADVIWSWVEDAADSEQDLDDDALNNEQHDAVLSLSLKGFQEEVKNRFPAKLKYLEQLYQDTGIIENKALDMTVREFRDDILAD